MVFFFSLWSQFLTKDDWTYWFFLSLLLLSLFSGDYASAIETLVTAISLIKQSKIANDDRCKILISSLQDTLHGIESKSYGSRYWNLFLPVFKRLGVICKETPHHAIQVFEFAWLHSVVHLSIVSSLCSCISSRDRRSRSRDRDRDRKERSSRRAERSRSRERDYRDRSRERDRYHESSRDRHSDRRDSERDREREREREYRSSRHWILLLVVSASFCIRLWSWPVSMSIRLHCQGKEAFFHLAVFWSQTVNDGNVSIFFSSHCINSLLVQIFTPFKCWLATMWLAWDIHPREGVFRPELCCWQSNCESVESTGPKKCLWLIWISKNRFDRMSAS